MISESWWHNLIWLVVLLVEGEWDLHLSPWEVAKKRPGEGTAMRWVVYNPDKEVSPEFYYAGILVCTTNLQSYEKIKFCCFSHSVDGILL